MGPRVGDRVGGGAPYLNGDDQSLACAFVNDGQCLQAHAGRVTPELLRGGPATRLKGSTHGLHTPALHQVRTRILDEGLRGGHRCGEGREARQLSGRDVKRG